MPKVSVFIPVYNGGKFIAATLDSIFQQTFQDFEVVVVNDGSTDDTMEVLATYTDPRLQVFSNPGNKGLTYTRNRGLDLANGEYLAINDCDDISHATRLQQQVEYLDKHQEVGIVGTSANLNKNGKFQNVWAYPSSCEGIKCRLFWGSSVINPTAMLRLSYIREHKLGYREEFPPCEDYDLFERAIHHFEIRNLPEVLLEYNMHGQNVTLTMNDKMREASNVIGLRQVQQLGVQLSEEGKVIYKKALNFDFSTSSNDLLELKTILENLVRQNQVQKIYNGDILHKQIAERWFQMCYHSKLKKSFQLYRSSFLSSLYPVSALTKLKFAVKSSL